MVVKNRIKLEFLSLPENVALARVTVAAFATQLSFTLDDLEEIKVVVSEAVSNSIIHGYQNQPSGLVTLKCEIVDDMLNIEVTDTGTGISNIEQALEPAFSSDPERMGLGFVFMQSFMNKFQVKSELGKGTTVIMSKYESQVAANVAKN